MNARAYRKARSIRANRVWLEIANDYYSNTMSIAEIRQKYINPKTEKPYSRQWIYKIVKRVGN